LILTALWLLFPWASWADTTNATQNLKSLSVEDLLKLKVTSVSKKEEQWFGTSAAISVITDEDIRRSGSQTIPDALRLAPGVSVGRVDSHDWAVGVRGFNETFNSGLLTLSDGRSIYTPLFGGTFWQCQNPMLEDVERIEVIRGPGAALWGANAFNGVLNVVTKPASETQGWLASAGGGSMETATTAVRYGDKLSKTTAYRVYGKYDNWDSTQLLDHSPANDRWWNAQGGFRLDSEPSDINRFTLQGNLYQMEANQNFPKLSLAAPYNSSVADKQRISGGNLLGRWTHAFSDESDFTAQVYYDRTDIDLPLLKDTQHTGDLDLRHRFHLGERQEVIWGGGYRVTQSSFTPSYEADFTDRTRDDQIGNLFVQDEVALVPDRLRLTLGTKLEHNNITDWEVAPSARLSWTPSERQTVWASVSRAVRTPTAFEDSGRIKLASYPPSATLPYPTLVELDGTPNFSPEELLAYELGYRIQPVERLTLDTTGFVNSYHHLRSTTSTADPSTLPAYLHYVTTVANGGKGEMYGAELAATWRVAAPWKLTGSYSFVDSEVVRPGSTAGTEAPVKIDYPAHIVSVRSSLNITRDIDFDLWVRWVSQVKDSGVLLPGSTVSPQIPAYATLDLRLAWRPTEHLELSIVGQNLIESEHREFNPSYFSTQATEVPRSVFGKLTWHY
jgi:iron complex outermembrane receptor protein